MVFVPRVYDISQGVSYMKLKWRVAKTIAAPVRMAKERTADFVIRPSSNSDFTDKIGMPALSSAARAKY